MAFKHFLCGAKHDTVAQALECENRGGTSFAIGGGGTATMVDQITEKQTRLIDKLAAEKMRANETISQHCDGRALTELSKRSASALIDVLIALPGADRTELPPDESAPQNGVQPLVSKPGIFKLPTGETYVVKPNKQGNRLYAKRLIEINGDRRVESGETVQIEFNYEQGAMARIREEHRMSEDEAKRLTIRYGKCVMCGRKLKNAESVDRGIGPICIKYVRGYGA